MSNKILILSDEFIARIHVGLGEVAAKFSIPVLQEIQTQIDTAEKDVKSFIAKVEAHIAPIKAAIVAEEAKLKAAADAAILEASKPVAVVERLYEEVKAAL
jgi:hypothetical protein